MKQEISFNAEGFGPRLALEFCGLNSISIQSIRYTYIEAVEKTYFFVTLNCSEDRAKEMKKYIELNS